MELNPVRCENRTFHLRKDNLRLNRSLEMKSYHQVYKLQIIRTFENFHFISLSCISILKLQIYIFIYLYIYSFKNVNLYFQTLYSVPKTYNLMSINFLSNDEKCNYIFKLSNWWLELQFYIFKLFICCQKNYNFISLSFIYNAEDYNFISLSSIL